MHYKKPLHKTSKENIYHLAPIPFYKRVFDNDVITDDVYNLGLDVLNKEQRQMGQELINNFDESRYKDYKINYNREDEWVEEHEKPPIGSRFYVEPNNFLDFDDESVNIIKRRIKVGFKELLWSQDHRLGIKPIISESWLQYYDPNEGRGHNAHNHHRWNNSEEQPRMFSGGYYLSDGNPLLDHPYSGAFAFHIRGSKYYIRPKAGMLLIWPHDIIHSVEPFYGESYRAVINFNIQLG